MLRRPPRLALFPSPPLVQTVVGPPALIVGVGGSGLTVTAVADDVALQPLPSETVTVEFPAPGALQGLLLPAPNGLPFSFHWLPLGLLCVMGTLPPVEESVGP